MPRGQNQEEVVRCPCCGMVAPAARFTEESEPFDFEQTTRKWGGKVALSDEDREQLIFEGKIHKEIYRGSGPGRIEYDPWHKPDAEHRHAFAARLAQVQALYGE